MNRNIFDIFKEMNEADEANKTAHLSVSPYFEAANKTKQGGVVKMGVADNDFWDIINEKKMCILLCIDRAEYDRLKTIDAIPAALQGEDRLKELEAGIMAIWKHFPLSALDDQMGEDLAIFLAAKNNIPSPPKK